jgi:hypothetical protein
MQLKKRLRRLKSSSVTTETAAPVATETAAPAADTVTQLKNKTIFNSIFKFQIQKKIRNFESII